MGLFGKAKGVSLTLIDIDTSSVGGALVRIEKGTPPTIQYASRTDISAHPGEDVLSAAIRTLEEKAHELIKEGGPALRRATGSGHSEHLIVQIGTPWQKTYVRREEIADAKPFTFTRAIEREILKKSGSTVEGYQSSEETVIATLLNGYETPNPFGKQVKQAELVILSSWMDKGLVPLLQKTLRSAYHTHGITLTTTPSVSYTVFRTLFPHEKNYLILEISGENVDLSYVKNGILVQVSCLGHGFNDILRNSHAGMPKAATEQSASALLDPAKNTQFAESVARAEKEWVEKLEGLFKEFASEQALPRTIFLIAPDDASDYLAHLIDCPSLRSLWLSDEPLRIIGISTAHLATFVATGPEAAQDTALGILALYSSQAIHTQVQKS